MISHKHKFIFIHIPKTAGTSIERFLLEVEGVRTPACPAWGPAWGKTLKPSEREEYLIAPGQHNLFREYDQKYRAAYFSFAFVRNPFDRAVSSFFYEKRWGRSSSFKDFLKNPRHENDVHAVSQRDFIINKSNEPLVDFIGRFENLQDDFGVVCDKIGIQRKKLPCENKRQHKHYAEYYNDETREIVAEKYAKDIECFGYKFEK
jgi:hypothetical protein